MNLLKAYFHYMDDPAPALRAYVAEKAFSRACGGFAAAALSWVLFGWINGLLITMALISAAWPELRLGVLAPVGMLLMWGLKLGYLSRGLVRLYQVTASKAVGAWLCTLVPLAAVAVLAGAFVFWTLALLF